ncbi:MAG: hypothetical protein ACTSYQ_02215 [Candidatus Odinarchaeia archaeon]
MAVKRNIMVGLCVCFIFLGCLSIFSVGVKASSAVGSWSPPLSLSADDGFLFTSGSSRAVVADTDNNLHVVVYGSYKASDNTGYNFNIYYLSNRSGFWKVVNISGVDNSSRPQKWPVIALDSNGNLHVVWSGFVDGQYDLYYVNNTGGGWSTPHQITYTSDINETYPSIAIDPYDILHVATIASNESTCYLEYTAKNSSGYWSPPVNITDPNMFNRISEGLSVCADTAGNVYVAFSGATSSVVDVFFVNGSKGVWGAPLNVSSNAATYDAYPSIAVDSKGVVHIVWGSGVGYWPWLGSVKYANISAGNLSSLLSISGTGYWGFHTSIFIDLNDKVHIAFSQRISATGANEIYYVNSTFGVFTSPVNVPHSPGCDDNYPQIAVTNQGTIYIFYTAAFNVVYTYTRTQTPKGVEDITLPLVIVGVVLVSVTAISLTNYLVKSKTNISFSLMF